MSSEDVKKLINPIVEKLAQAISTKTIELNGGKAPAAVFLVGGGAHTPGLLGEIAKKLNIPEKRITIKDRSTILECVSDNKIGSAGVTVLGIALTAIRSLGNDFIDVKLNGEPVSLFNSHKHTVMDVLLQAGINPALLIAKTGKNIRFSVNGRKRLAFGDIGVNAVITINGQEADIESEIDAHDEIEVVYAQNGKDAEAKVSEFLTNINSITIYVDEEIVNIDPVCIINDEISHIDEHIKEGDDVQVFIPNKICDLKKYVLKSDKTLVDIEYREFEEDYRVLDGEKVFIKTEADEIAEIRAEEERKRKEEAKKNAVINTVNAIKEFNEFKRDLAKEKEELIKETVEETLKEVDSKETSALEEQISEPKEIEKETIAEETEDGLMVIVNKEKVYLKNKQSYIFVDIFNFIDFDLTKMYGTEVVLKLNGKEAAYTDVLKEGDEIEVYWK